MDKHLNNVTGNLCRYLTSVNFMERVLNVLITLHKEYNKKRIVIRTCHIMKDIIGSVFLPVMINQFYSWYIRIFEILLQNKVILSLMKTLNGNDIRPKRLSLPRFVDVKLYAATTEELPIVFRASNDFVKNQSGLSIFPVFTSNTCANVLFAELKLVYVNHYTESSWEFLVF